MTESESAVPSHTGVVGGGRMGTGIAHALLLVGSNVVLLERDAERASAAQSQILRALEQSEARGMLAQGTDEASARLKVASSVSSLAGSELVVEAIPEDINLKASMFVEIDRAVSPSTVIATNTSSLSVADLASRIQFPQRVLGLHFFNPVPSSKLVEVIWTPLTDPELIDRATQWVEALGKTPVAVRDSPGFATSRLGVALGLEAIRMLEEDVASAEDIDKAMVLGYNHPVGPLKLTDLVGLDVRLDIARHLTNALGSRFEPPPLLIDKVVRGEFGVERAGRDSIPGVSDGRWSRLNVVT